MELFIQVFLIWVCLTGDDRPDDDHRPNNEI